MASANLSVADAITELRREIITASDRARNEEVQFEISKMTLELNVVATFGVDGKAGFKVPVVNLELGGTATSSQQYTHRVTLELSGPIAPDSSSVRVGRTHDQPLD